MAGIGADDGRSRDHGAWKVKTYPADGLDGDAKALFEAVADAADMSNEAFKAKGIRAEIAYVDGYIVVEAKAKMVFPTKRGDTLIYPAEATVRVYQRALDPKPMPGLDGPGGIPVGRLSPKALATARAARAFFEAAKAAANGTLSGFGKRPEITVDDRGLNFWETDDYD